MSRKKTRNHYHKKKNISRNTKDISGEVMHVRDANSREIFKNNLLACQFLKDYSGISIFSDLRPEDIEDQTAKFRVLLGIQVEGDTVKKIHVQADSHQEDIYVVALVEHKSRVAYDVGMQLLLYMAVIWRDYARKFEEEARDKKSFRYPLIIPIVYYEGADRWTADMHLSDRIAYSDLARECIPDFTYKIVPLREYNNTDLESRNNEMSLVMMINKIQTSEDYKQFVQSAEKYMDRIYKNTSPEIRNLIIEVLRGLLLKMKLPTEETTDILKNFKEDDDMGILFANLQDLDIQAQREENKKVREDYEKGKKELEQKKEALDQKEEALDQKEEALDQKEEALDQKEKELDQKEEALEMAVKSLQDSKTNFIKQQKSEGKSREAVSVSLIEIFNIKDDEAESILEEVWETPSEV